MADVQTFTSWSSTSANNFPTGGTIIGSGADDNFREIQAQTAAWRDGLGYGELNLSGVSGTNSIAGNTSPAPALAANQKYWFIPQATNTGPSFLNVNSAGSKPIFSAGATCVGGEIQISVPASVSYDGTNFHLRGKGPFIDSAPLVIGSGDQTKKWKVEVDGLTTGTMRTFTPPDQDLTISALLAKGDLWVGSSTGVATTKSVGADGQVLTASSASAGGVTWAAPGMVLLSTKTAANSATIDFTSSDFDFTAYETYIFEITRLVPVTNNISLGVRLSTNGGSTYEAGATSYGYSNKVLGINGTTYDLASAGDAQAFFGATTNGISSTTSQGGVSATLKLHSPNNTVNSKAMTWLGSYAGSVTFATISGSGFGVTNLTTSAVNGIRFIPSSGNHSIGTIRAYGVRSS